MEGASHKKVWGRVSLGRGMTGAKALRWKGASLFSGQKEGGMAGGGPSCLAGGQEVRLGLVCLSSTTRPVQGSELGAAVEAGRLTRRPARLSLGKALPSSPPLSSTLAPWRSNPRQLWPDCLGSRPNSAAHQLCDLKEVT